VVPAVVHEPFVPHEATPWSTQLTAQQMSPMQLPLTHCALLVHDPLFAIWGTHAVPLQ
jgi:hypothetical protein